MRDFFGRELELGAEVAFVITGMGNHHFSTGRITKINEKTVTVTTKWKKYVRKPEVVILSLF